MTQKAKMGYLVYETRFDLKIYIYFLRYPKFVFKLKTKFRDNVRDSESMHSGRRARAKK